MMRTPVLAIAFAVAFAPQGAAAKLACYPLAQIERSLDAEYGEVRHFGGRESTGTEYRLYVNAKTGSWSWIGIPAGTGLGCLIFAGGANDAPPAAPSRAPAVPEAQF